MFLAYSNCNYYIYIYIYIWLSESKWIRSVLFNILYNYVLSVATTFYLGMAKRASPPRIGPPRAWPAKMRDGLARLAKLLRARISDPPRIRAGPRVCGPARILFFFKLNIFFFTFLFLKNCQIKPIYFLLSNLIFFFFLFKYSQTSKH